VSGPDESRYDPDPGDERRLPRIAWFPLLAVCVLIGVDLYTGIFRPLDLLLIGTVLFALVATYFGLGGR